MIISSNAQPDYSEFAALMAKTNSFLNHDARIRPAYYVTRGGSALEDDVKCAMEYCARGTAFENTIEKISGHKFPDIVAARLYGVEVKSTTGNHWTSTGSSILESTRVPGVERIFLTFGKLGGNPIEFLSKPYEQCLSDIAVTHMPRYLINMQLAPGETIFDKMNIPYDILRTMANPFTPIANYYRQMLKPGERLWWAGDSGEETVSAKIRLWRQLSSDEKVRYMVYGCVNFPEIFGGNYDNYALWLTSEGVVDPHIRDQFSAGGQELLYLSDGSMIKFPGVYRRIKDNMDLFLYLMGRQNPNMLQEQGAVSLDVLRSRLLFWIDLASTCAASRVDSKLSVDALRTLFAVRIPL